MSLLTILSGETSGGGPTPTATAVFVDYTQGPQGAWHGIYGTDAAILPATSPTLTLPPGYGTLTLGGNFFFQYVNTITTPGYDYNRALQKATGTDRFAASWYNQTAVQTIRFVGTATARKLSLYLLDWDKLGDRYQKITVTDTGTGIVLDTAYAYNFPGGAWISWNVTGDVTITLDQVTNGRNQNYSGVFFDPAATTFHPENKLPLLTYQIYEDMGIGGNTILTGGPNGTAYGFTNDVKMFSGFSQIGSASPIPVAVDPSFGYPLVDAWVFYRPLGPTTPYGQPGATYTMTYDGDGFLFAYGNAHVVSQTKVGNTTTATIAVNTTSSTGDAQSYYQWTGVNPANPLMNMTLYPPGVDPSEEFTPTTRQICGELTGVQRFMEHLGINAANQTTWDLRVKYGHVQEGQASIGGSIESTIHLCNRIGRGGWWALPVGATDAYRATPKTPLPPVLEVPLGATDDYRRRMMEQIRDELDPSLPIYLVYGNEPWNTVTPLQFDISQRAVSNPDPRLTAGHYLSSTGYFQRSAQQYAEEAYQTALIAQEVFGADYGVRVFMGINGATIDSYCQLILQYINNNYGPAGQWFHFLEMATYFNPQNPDGTGINKNTPGITADTLLTGVETALTHELGYININRYRGLIQGIEWWAVYEANAELSNQVTNQAPFVAAYNDDRMEGITAAIPAYCKARGAKTYCHYADMATGGGKNGYWGEMPRFDTPLEQAPVRRGLLDAVAAAGPSNPIVLAAQPFVDTVSTTGFVVHQVPVGQISGGTPPYKMAVYVTPLGGVFGAPYYGPTTTFADVPWNMGTAGTQWLVRVRISDALVGFTDADIIPVTLAGSPAVLVGDPFRYLIAGGRTAGGVSSGLPAPAPAMPMRYRLAGMTTAGGFATFNPIVFTGGMPFRYVIAGGRTAGGISAGVQALFAPDLLAALVAWFKGSTLPAIVPGGMVDQRASSRQGFPYLKVMDPEVIDFQSEDDLTFQFLLGCYSVEDDGIAKHVGVLVGNALRLSEGRPPFKFLYEGDPWSESGLLRMEGGTINPAGVLAGGDRVWRYDQTFEINATRA